MLDIAKLCKDESIRNNGVYAMIVSKFGGTSLASARNFRLVKDILQENRQRRVVVVSAPGKRFEGDLKMTDLLLSAYQKAREGTSFDEELRSLHTRFEEIVQGLGLSLDVQAALEEVADHLRQGGSKALIISRGEHICAQIMAEYLAWTFIPAQEVIRFFADGRLDEASTLMLLKEALTKSQPAVLPGFFGADPSGQIQVLARGGSDISGALAAAAVDAELYENWTDVTGFRSADPRIVPDASYISYLSYRELRELSYMGASVIHEKAVYPVRKAGIPIAIRNTFDPLHPGTQILHSTRLIGRIPTVTGIAGKQGFSLINLEKDRMNDEIGFGRKVLTILEKHGLGFEHLPTGIDDLCIILTSKSLEPCREVLLQEIEQAVHPDTLTVQDGLALVACVGIGMFKVPGTIARLFTAVAEQGITIRTMLQAPSELSIIIGVDEAELNLTVKTLYDAFLRD